MFGMYTYSYKYGLVFATFLNILIFIGLILRYSKKEKVESALNTTNNSNISK